MVVKWAVPRTTGWTGWTGWTGFTSPHTVHEGKFGLCRETNGKAVSTSYMYMYMYMRISENHNSLGCEQPSRPRCTCTCSCSCHANFPKDLDSILIQRKYICMYNTLYLYNAPSQTTCNNTVYCCRALCALFLLPATA